MMLTVYSSVPQSTSSEACPWLLIHFHQIIIDSRLWYIVMVVSAPIMSFVTSKLLGTMDLMLYHQVGYLTASTHSIAILFRVIHWS